MQSSFDKRFVKSTHQNIGRKTKMRFPKQRVSSLLTLLFCCLQNASAIINRPTAESSTLSVSKQLGSSYLNQQRPLWILEDQVPQRDYAELMYTTESPYNYRRTQAMSQQKLDLESQQQSTAVQRQFNEPKRFAQQLSKHRQQQFVLGTYSNRRQMQQYAQPARVYKHMPRLQHPRRYLPQQRMQFQQSLRTPTVLARKQPRFIATSSNVVSTARRHEDYIPHLSLPTFDSLPGDESVRSAPVFIYTGPKGELILNTMLTAPQYPMQEPVPGQVLYPPSVPVFRPKPIVERFRMPGSTQTLNLTLIPFYEHEAIDIRQASRMLDHEQALGRAASTTAAPTVLYAAPVAAMPSIADTSTAESAPKAKKLHFKKAKHYSAYHSPNEVQWTPMTSEQLKLMTTSTITPFPQTAPSPPQNHRYTTDVGTTSTTMPSLSNYKITYESETDSVEEEEDMEKNELLANGDQLQIVYMDDSLEKPTAPTKPPLLSSRYSLSKEYYAFPVFTLGKLLKPDTEGTEKPLPAFMVQNTIDSPMSKSEQPTKAASAAPEQTASANMSAEVQADDEEDLDDVETWFILNSRYKGQHNQNNNEYRLSSKYIHTTDVRELDE